LVNKDSLEDSLVNVKNNYYTDLSNKFIRESSYFFNEIKELMDKEMKNGTDLKIFTGKNWKSHRCSWRRIRVQWTFQRKRSRRI